MHIKCLENPVNVLKKPNEPRKIPRLNTTVLLFYVDTRIFLKAIRGHEYRFVPKGGKFPTEIIPISCRGPKHAPKEIDFIFNQFICTRACACSSNLNYAHECIENLVNV